MILLQKRQKYLGSFEALLVSEQSDQRKNTVDNIQISHSEVYELNNPEFA